MPEARFKELFYSTSPRLKTPDDLCSVITLGLLGPEYMAGALYKGGDGAEAGRGTAGGRLKKRGKRSRKAKRKRKKRTLPLQLLSGRTPWTRRSQAPRYNDVQFVSSIPRLDRSMYEQNQLQLERNYMDKLYGPGIVNRLRRDWRI